VEIASCVGSLYIEGEFCKTGFIAEHQDIFLTAHHSERVEPLEYKHAETNAYVSFATEIEHELGRNRFLKEQNKTQPIVIGPNEKPSHLSVPVKLLWIPPHNKTDNPRYDIEIWRIDWSAWPGSKNDTTWKPKPARISEDPYVIDQVSLQKLSQPCTDSL